MSAEPEDVISEREQELHNTAERFATQMGAQFDVDLDFSVESLTRLDGMLSQMIDLTEAYWSDRPDDLLPVALALTAYVGEVIRRALNGAAWVTDMQDGEIPPPHIELKQGMRLNLMKKSIQILSRHDSPSFATYLQTVQEIARSRNGEPERDA